MPNLTVNPHIATGISFVDALLSVEGGYWAAADTTQPFSVTYSTANSNTVYDLPYSSLQEPERGSDLVLSDVITAAFDQAITAWTNVANITVTKVNDTGGSYGDIRLGATRAVDVVQSIHPGTEAYAYLPLPDHPNEHRNGDIWLGPDALNYDYSTATNGLGYFLLLSNIGHALFGLENVSTLAGLNGSILDPTLNQTAWTVMSDHPGQGLAITAEQAAAMTESIRFPTTPMPLDILAIQSIYGANYNYNADNTVYSFGFNEHIFRTIWDGGGFDVIDWSNQTSAGYIDLNQGAFSQLGPARFDGQDLIPQTLAIAFNTVIEAARGGSAGDTIIGNDTANLVHGNDGADSITGGNGTDLLYGNAGDDTIYGNIDIDYLFGGQGADRLFGGKDIDLIYGNLDSDILYGNFGNDVIFGGSGNDTIFGGQDNDYITGNLDNDILYGNAGADSLYGGDGNDRLYGNDQKDFLYGNTGNDALDGGGDDDTLYGEDGADSLVGGDEEDVLYGGDGNDTLNGGASEDILYGGDGNDNLTGGDGADVLDGGAGNDTLSGGNGDDVYYYYSTGQTISESGDGYDVVYTQVNYVLGANIESGVIIGPNSITLTGNELANALTGNEHDNSIEGGAGNDTIYGGDGSDTLSGSAGSDKLFGGAGDDVYIIADADSLTGATDLLTEDITGGIDTIITSVNITLPQYFENLILNGTVLDATGNSDNNLITGSASNNLINGSGGNDTLIGGAGADTLLGGLGNDLLTGGSGIDVFRYTGSNGNDTISDYEVGIDQVQLMGGVTVASSADVSGNAQITLSSGDIITLIGVTSTDITFIM